MRSCRYRESAEKTTTSTKQAGGCSADGCASESWFAVEGVIGTGAGEAHLVTTDRRLSLTFHVSFEMRLTFQS